MTKQEAIDIIKESLNNGLLCICGGMFDKSDVINCSEALKILFYNNEEN